MKSPRVRAIARARGWRPFDKALGVYTRLYESNGHYWYAMHFIDDLRKTKKEAGE